LENVFADRGLESSRGNLTIGLECLVFGDCSLSIVEKLNEVLFLEVRTNGGEAGEQAFGVGNASCEVSDGELRDVEVLRSVLAGIENCLESFEDGVSGYDEIGDIL